MNEGVLLFDSSRVQLAKPKALNAGERMSLAEKNPRYWSRAPAVAESVEEALRSPG